MIEIRPATLIALKGIAKMLKIMITEVLLTVDSFEILLKEMEHDSIKSGRDSKDRCDACETPTDHSNARWYYDEASWYCNSCEPKIFAEDREEQEKLQSKPLSDSFKCLECGRTMVHEDGKVLCPECDDDPYICSSCNAETRDISKWTLSEGSGELYCPTCINRLTKTSKPDNSWKCEKCDMTIDGDHHAMKYCATCHDPICPDCVASHSVMLDKIWCKQCKEKPRKFCKLCNKELTYAKAIMRGTCAACHKPKKKLKKRLKDDPAKPPPDEPFIAMCDCCEIYEKEVFECDQCGKFVCGECTSVIADKDGKRWCFQCKDEHDAAHPDRKSEPADPPKENKWQCLGGCNRQISDGFARESCEMCGAHVCMECIQSMDKGKIWCKRCDGKSE